MDSIGETESALLLKVARPVGVAAIVGSVALAVYMLYLEYKEYGHTILTGSTDEQDYSILGFFFAGLILAGGLSLYFLSPFLAGIVKESPVAAAILPVILAYVIFRTYSNRRGSD